ncbi:hypothetical protein [Halpernia frigidisoli]|uniref:Uncharacterized protein n=1 Tax=Halpernia frigidisoli TaxID=1125876 RepID=A0A1I3HLA8_9FLAO|nr:hypothetical protein [Halpernia frigidisoli]SFI36461.1 hypothetical protein SAMN05443292_2273 [Halpernia frigidisoli]
MITSEENIEIGEFLKEKNLPLDLRVEILDHIREQLSHKMEVESKDFYLAFSEIKESWKEDLVMKKTFFIRESRTNIHRKTNRKADLEILKKSGLYFAIYFLLSSSFLYFNKTLAHNFILGIYSLMTFMYLWLLLFNYKMLKITAKSKRRKISYLQQGTAVFTMVGIFIPVYVLFDFENKFDRYYLSIFNLINHGEITVILFATLFTLNIYAYGWLYGFINFLEYKKSLKILEQKINFKL